ncbi:MAG: DUF86 domain-containing protein [Thermodesulfovibrio aggregans]|uniref:DUF86 domain-containing protein n=2 Tax=Thermodesulfovibrio TaxID=28261 RepID=A0A2J6WQ65_9BACT|nr:MAG: DUF86 domain-containing protein [Thermodesulfovibrio aggregans]
MLNPERIMLNFKEIDEALEQLERIKRMHLEEFLNNPDYRYIAYASFIIFAEAVIDICYHFAVKKFKLTPSTYAECFEILKEKGIFSQNISEALSSMDRFRNLLIHRYKQVDFKKVYEFTKNLEVIGEFKKTVIKLLEAETENHERKTH